MNYLSPLKKKKKIKVKLIKAAAQRLTGIDLCGENTWLFEVCDAVSLPFTSSGHERPQVFTSLIQSSSHSGNNILCAIQGEMKTRLSRPNTVTYGRPNLRRRPFVILCDSSVRVTKAAVVFAVGRSLSWHPSRALRAKTSTRRQKELVIWSRQKVEEKEGHHKQRCNNRTTHWRGLTMPHCRRTLMWTLQYERRSSSPLQRHKAPPSRHHEYG